MDLDDFISLEHNAGTVVSTGQFTVDPTKMIEKLGQFLLEDDSQAVLKIIQGCIGSRAEEIWVVSGSRDLTVYFTTWHASDTVQRLSEMFGEIFLGLADSPERDLLLGICHFLNYHPECIGLSRWDKGQLETWSTLSGDQPDRVRRYPKGMRTGMGLHIYLPKSGRAFKPAAGWNKRCFFAPVPVHSQGYLVGSKDDAPFTLASTLLEFHSPGDDPVHGKIAPRWRGKAQNNLGFDLGWTSGDNAKEVPPIEMRAFGHPGQVTRPPVTFTPRQLGVMEGLLNRFDLRLPHCTGCLYLARWRSPKPEHCAIHAVKRGVVLDPIHLELPSPGALIYLACDDIATDLSTLKVHDDARPDLIHRALLLLKEGLEICEENRERLPVDINYSEPRTFLTIGATVLASVALGAVTGFVPLVWPGAIGAGFLGAYIEKLRIGPGHRAEQLQSLHDDIQALNERLAQT